MAFAVGLPTQDTPYDAMNPLTLWNAQGGQDEFAYELRAQSVLDDAPQVAALDDYTTYVAAKGLPSLSDDHGEVTAVHQGDKLRIERNSDGSYRTWTEHAIDGLSGSQFGDVGRSSWQLPVTTLDAVSVNATVFDGPELEIPSLSVSDLAPSRSLALTDIDLQAMSGGEVGAVPYASPIPGYSLGSGGTGVGPVDWQGQPLHGESNFSLGNAYGNVWRSEDSVGRKVINSFRLLAYEVPDADERWEARQEAERAEAARFEKLDWAANDSFGPVAFGIAKLLGKDDETAYKIGGTVTVVSPVVIAAGGAFAVRGGITPQNPNRIPLGFEKASDFEVFGSSLHNGLASVGYRNVKAAFQGSSVTGHAYKPPHDPFDVGRVSDYDIAISSPELFQRAKEIGLGLRQQGTRTGPLRQEHLDKLGLSPLATKLSTQAGRPVNFMIYRSIDDAMNRSPSIIVPRNP